LGQTRGIGWPHETQKRAFSALAVPQCGQIMRSQLPSE
jgi:hypothetical protein